MDEKAIIEAQREAYRTNFLVHGDSPLGTYQNNRVTQYIRFETLLRQIMPHVGPGTSLHDIGSGLCDLYQFLRERGLDGDITYSGTEIVQEMVDLAAAKYPELTLLNRDFLDVDISDRYDFVVLSGTFNIPGGVDGESWKAMCLALIDKMYKHADKGIAFNFLTSYRTFSNPDLYYFDPREIFDHATTNLSRFVHIDAAYPLYECSVTVFKNDYISSLYDHPDLKKYF